LPDIVSYSRHPGPDATLKTPTRAEGDHLRLERIASCALGGASNFRRLSLAKLTAVVEAVEGDFSILADLDEVAVGLMAAFQRIFGATIFLGTDTQREKAAVVHRARFSFMSEARIWYSRNTEQETLPCEFQNEIVLCPEFFKEILDHRASSPCSNRAAGQPPIP